jgi:hypothetical protein
VDNKEVEMIISTIFSVILGTIVAGLTGIGLLFWIVSILVFVCSLPFMLIDGYIQSKIDYVQDREDYRQAMHEIVEGDRMHKYLDKFDDFDYSADPDIYIDNRQIHIHNYEPTKNIKSTRREKK